MVHLWLKIIGMVISGIYTSLIALYQEQIRKLLASSLNTTDEGVVLLAFALLIVLGIVGLIIAVYTALAKRYGWNIRKKIIYDPSKNTTVAKVDALLGDITAFVVVSSDRTDEKHVYDAASSYNMLVGRAHVIAGTSEDLRVNPTILLDSSTANKAVEHIRSCGQMLLGEVQAYRTTIKPE